MNKNLKTKIAAAIAVVALSAGLCFNAAQTTTYANAATETLSDYADVSVSSEYFAGAPTVVASLDGSEKLAEITAADEAPENLIITLDGNANAVGANGEVIGSYKEVMQAVYKKTIPVINLPSADAKDAFVAANNEFEIKDLSIMSGDSNVLLSARTEVYYARGIYDVSDKNYSFSGERGRKNLLTVLQTANASMANIIVLGEKQATREAVEFFQFRFKTVWVALGENAEAFDVQKIVSSGAYGIVSADYASVYSVYMGYLKGEDNQKPFVRRPANIAHRGLPNSMPENTVAGFVAAIDGGATHVETDVQLTKDKQLVLMHDGSIRRTTDFATVGGGVEAISALTYEQLKQYSVVFGAKKEPIPLLEDAFKALKDKDAVLVLEIKQSHNDIVRLIREKIEEYDFWDKIVLISFYNEELAKAFEIIPEVPTASLNGLPVNEVTKSEYYNKINTVADSNNANTYFTESFCDGFMKNRGYLGYYWTYSTDLDSYSAAQKGVFGITNNDATGFAEFAHLEIEGLKDQKIKRDSLLKGGDIAVKLKNYCGSKQRVGKIFSVKKGADSAEVIAYLETEDMVLYSEPFTVGYSTSSGGGSSQGEGGGSSCSTSIAGTDVFACALIALGVCVFRFKRRYNR